MKNFSRRLKYYGIGFGLGLVFVLFFFQNRGCSWLPENRVKNAVLTRVIVVPEQQEAALNAQGIDTKEIIQYLVDGDVDFGDSEKSDPDKRYKITLDDHPDLYFTLPGESYISAVYIEPNAEVKTRTGKAKMVHFSSYRRTCIR